MKFPFLYNYKKMKKITNRVAISNHLESHYEIKILKKIAKELKNQIHFDEMSSNLDLKSNNNNNNLIYYWITKRYLTEIYQYFRYIILFLEDDNKNELIHLFTDFQKRMLILMKEYIEKEQKSARELLDKFESDNLLIP